MSERLDPSVWKIALVAMLGVLLAQLDATIVNVSLSSLATELHTNLSTIHWVTSGYLLALALMLPLNGWLVDRIGAKALYLWCFSAFVLSSALCGFAWSAVSLIGFRVLQGMSGGLLAPMAQMMVARAAGRQMARVMGYMALVVMIGPILGPVIAGAILSHFSWRWLFFVNLPVGVLAILMAVLFLPDDRAETHRRDLDLGGLALLSPALVLFLYGADHISELVGEGMVVLALILAVLFLRRSSRLGRNALIHLDLFKGRVFPVSAATQFFANGISFAGQMLIPYFLVRAAGLSPSAAGWMLAPQGVGMACSAPSLGMLTARFGIRKVAASGALLSLVSTLPFLFIAGRPLVPVVVGCVLFVRGIGLGVVGIPSMTAAYTSVPKSELPMATTTMNIVQRIGGPTLTTICATFLTWRLASVPAPGSPSAAFAWAFGLLCCFHAVMLASALRLPLTVEAAAEGAAPAGSSPGIPLDAAPCEA